MKKIGLLIATLALTTLAPLWAQEPPDEPSAPAWKSNAKRWSTARSTAKPR